MHSCESRFLIGLSDILFGGVYVCTFDRGNFTGWGSERVNLWGLRPQCVCVERL